MAERQQVKSRQRAEEHSEVFTNEREVNAMLDMIEQETERIDSRFLEPACGDGNFLAEVLNANSMWSANATAKANWSTSAMPSWRCRPSMAWTFLANLQLILIAIYLKNTAKNPTTVNTPQGFQSQKTALSPYPVALPP